METRRRLPHIHHIGQPVFVTWTLHDSLPAGRHFAPNLTAGQTFVAMDRLLDQATTGPRYLRQPEIAQIVADALIHGSLHQYELHAWVVMPNHVHILITPNVPLAKITKSLKGFTARKANLILKLSGKPFWQQEFYDHEVLNDIEFDKIVAYIENNPVRAGLSATPDAFRWSSGSGTWTSRAGLETHPTL